MKVPFDVDQVGWGSMTEYPDDPNFHPKYLIIHWGGGTSQIPADAEDDRLRIWQRYHINSKGWTDIAYNFAVGESGTIYRLRGYNRGGHVKTSDVTPEDIPYNDCSLGIVWVSGKADVDGPSPEALVSMENIAKDTGLIVKPHRQVKEENNSWTECPGDDWIQWISEESWLGDMEYTHYQIGVEYREYEEISWLLFLLLGGRVDPNLNSAQIEILLQKDNVRMVTETDFDLIADFTGMSAGARDRLKVEGLYRFGKEIAALRQYAFTGSV